MPILNTAATNQQIGHVGTDYATAQVVIYDGATALATHTLDGFGAPSSGTIALTNVPNTDVIDNAGTVDSAKLIAGALEMDVTVGLTGSNAELILGSLTYVLNETSRINSLTLTQPAA